MRKILIFWMLLLGVAGPGYSQLLSIGIKAGVPLNDALHGYSSSGGNVSTSTERWFAGPTAELHFPFRLSFEVNALYRKDSYVVSSSAGSTVASQWFNVVPTTVALKNSLSNWQFPFLAKYDLHGGVIRPIIDGGVTYRHLSGSGPIDNSNGTGVTIGGGLTVKLLFLRLSPEIRYTRWGRDDVHAPYVTSSQNQADVMVGFTF